MIMNSGMARVAAAVAHTGLACALLCEALVSPALVTAQQHQPKAKALNFSWRPPQVDQPLKSLIAGSPCVLPGALETAGESANALFRGLKGFTAREDIQFQSSRFIAMSQDFIPQKDFAWSYDYVVFFSQAPTGLIAQDSRTSRAGHQSQAFDQDLGLPELPLIFLPEMQTDYDFRCEGTVQWSGQAAWVIGFQQRKDKPHRTISLRGMDHIYPASLRGRAWISADSGEILHMVTSLMGPAPEVGILNWYLSVDYAAVVFPPKNVRLILPQTVEAFCELSGWRTVTYHSFSDFKLFGVDISIKPVEPDNH